MKCCWRLFWLVQFCLGQHHSCQQQQCQGHHWPWDLVVQQQDPAPVSPHNGQS
jgi:hypothetical protein